MASTGSKAAASWILSPLMARMASTRKFASLASTARPPGYGSGWDKKPPSSGKASKSLALGLGGLAAAAATYIFYENAKGGVAHAKSKSNGQAKSGVTLRQLRFKSFASVAYGDDVFMTPRDFIESLTETIPRSRATRRAITNKELDLMYSSTPPTKKGSSALFRKLQDQGIISYTEYLFLLSILTKPQSGFEIAFNMFDTDGNQRVDKHEFLVLKHMVAFHVWKEKTWDEQIAEIGHDLAKFASGPISIVEKKISDIVLKRATLAVLHSPNNEKVGHKNMAAKPFQAQHVDVRDDNVVNTTLLVHFFGVKGNGVLSYEDFRRFMENLQTEVLEIEFHEFAKGLVTISEVDFAKILLRYTLLHSDDHEAYLSRLQDRITHKQGITFAEFKAFCQFLNNLDDFAIAMRMYTLSDQPISRDEFNRAVKICTGESLSDHLVRTVFQIFDEDGDGHLSYKEFIAIMRDRLHRGFRPSLMKNEGWEAFKSCVRGEMKAVM